MDRIPLKNISDIYDGPHATPKKTEEGPIYLGIDAISNNGTIDYKQCSHLSEVDYKKWTKRVTPMAGDIVFSYEATLGKYAIIPSGFYGCLGRRLAIIRNKSEFINTKWLYYYFRSPEWTGFINQQIIKGSTVNRISIEAFPDYTIPKIPIDIQEKIANILSVIDRKIILNDAINDNLQQMAYTQFMHMFYGRKSNGKIDDILIEQPKSSIQVGDAKGIQGSIPFFTSGEAILKWNEPIVTGRNCFLNTGGNADVKFYVGESAYSTDTWCITAQNNMADYLYLLLDSIKLELNLKFFQGTGLKHLQKPLLRDRPIYIPTADELNEFNYAVNPWLSIISDNIRESEQLISIRNWLLPMLMNGQATVSD